MNFYKHYIGDFQRDTNHLSLTERGAYRALLDHLYATEKPLPKNVQDLYRLVGAMDAREKAAVRRVIHEFWRLTDEGYINDRALKEIEKAEHQRQVNRAIAVAREGRRKEHDSCSDRGTNHQPNQTPDTRHQTKTRVLNTHTEQRTSPAVQSAEPPSVCVGHQTAAGAACSALRNAGIADTNPSHPTLLALVEAGATAEEFSDAAVECRAKGKATFAYVLGVVRRRREEAAKLMLHKGAMPTAPPGESVRDRKRREAYEAMTGRKGHDDEPRDITSIATRVG